MVLQGVAEFVRLFRHGANKRADSFVMLAQVQPSALTAIRSPYSRHCFVARNPLRSARLHFSYPSFNFRVARRCDGLGVAVGFALDGIYKQIESFAPFIAGQLHYRVGDGFQGHGQRHFLAFISWRLTLGVMPQFGSIVHASARSH